MKNFDRLGVGSTKNEVVAALGEPDYEKEIYPKDSERSCSFLFVYYFEKPNEVIDNVLHDKQVGVYFSASGAATWVVSNIDGLTEKGSFMTR